MPKLYLTKEDIEEMIKEKFKTTNDIEFEWDNKNGVSFEIALDYLSEQQIKRVYLPINDWGGPSKTVPLKQNGWEITCETHNHP